MRLMNPAIDTGTGDYFTNLIGGAAYLAGKSSDLARYHDDGERRSPST